MADADTYGEVFLVLRSRVEAGVTLVSGRTQKGQVKSLVLLLLLLLPLLLLRRAKKVRTRIEWVGLEVARMLVFLKARSLRSLTCRCCCW